MLTAFERAERCGEPAELAANLTFAVVDSGPTGIETAGAIAEIAFRTLTDEFRSIDPASAPVILLEELDRVLSSSPESLSAKALRQLRYIGVDVRLGVRVTDITDGVVTTSDGTIATHPVVSGAGNDRFPPLGSVSTRRHLGA